MNPNEPQTTTEGENPEVAMPATDMPEATPEAEPAA